MLLLTAKLYDCSFTPLILKMLYLNDNLLHNAIVSGDLVRSVQHIVCYRNSSIEFLPQNDDFYSSHDTNLVSVRHYIHISQHYYLFF